MRVRTRAVLASVSAVMFVLSGVGLLASTTFGLTIGNRVQTTDRLTVRSTANGTIVGYQALSSQGTVIAGPISSGSYQWAKVNYDTGVDGWSATNWLQEVSAAASTANTSLAPATFPIDMRSASLPEEKVVTVNTAIHAEATSAVVSMNVYDPDFANEGTLYINGRGSITLFGDQGTIANDTLTKTLTFSTPVSWWNNGANSLRFVHTETNGFTINSLSVSFLGGFPAPPTPVPSTPAPAQSTSKPVFKYPIATSGLVVGMNDLINLDVTAGPEGNIQLHKLSFSARVSNVTLSNASMVGAYGAVGTVSITPGEPNIITVYFDSSTNLSDAVIAAGQSRRFTLRANVGVPNSSLPSSVSTALKGDSTGVSLSPVSALGASKIIWSPMTSTQSRVSLNSADWTNSYGLGGCYSAVGVGQDCSPRTLQKSTSTSQVGLLYITGSNFPNNVLLAGTRSAFLGSVSLSVIGEPVQLNTVGLQFYSGLPTNFSGISLWDDATLVGKALFPNNTPHAVATLSVPVSVNVTAAGQTSKTLTIRGDVSPMGVGWPASSDALNLVSVDIDPSLTSGVGQYSQQRVQLGIVPTPPKGMGQRVLKTYPQTIAVLVNSANGVAGTNTLLPLRIQADPAGDLQLGRIAVSIKTQNATVSNLTLVGPNGSVTAGPLSAVVNPGAIQTVYIPFDSKFNTSDKIIAAGQVKDFTLRGTITPGSGSAAVVTTLLGDDPAAYPSEVAEPLQKYTSLVSKTTPRYFIWSPQSTTSSVTWEHNDWLASWQLNNIYFPNASNTITFSASTPTPSATIALANPTQSQYTIPNAIPISWKISGAPANSQVWISAALQAEKGNVDAAPLGGGTSGFTSQSKLVPVGASGDTYFWDASSEYLPGLYRIDANLQQCDPRGCQYNTSFNSTPTVFAKSTPVYVTLQNAKPAVSATITVNGNTQSQTIYRGEAVTVKWSSHNASSCDVLETYSNYKQNSLSGSWTRTPTKTTNYAIQCTNSSWAGTGDTTNIVSSSVTVEVKDAAVPAADLKVNGQDSINFAYGYGSTAPLSWTTQNVSSCNLTSNTINIGSIPTSATNYTTPPLYATSTFQLVCQDTAGRTASDSVIIPINSPAPSPSLCRTASKVFDVPGEYELIIPEGCYNTEAHVWGAGGAGSGNETGVGGTGGYSRGTLSLGPLRTIKIIVGEGGKATGARSIGGGGAGTERTDYLRAFGGSGGGMSAVFDTKISQATALLVAGGGGGAGKCGNTTGGGAGGRGAERSGKVAGEVGGGAGTTAGGGAATAPGQAGSALNGGNGGKDGAAGGGGGYFGGGGGAGLCSSGGGGSGFASPKVVSWEINGGANGTGDGKARTIVAGSSSSYYTAPTGYGGSASTPAGDGRVVIVFTSGKGALPGPVFAAPAGNINQMAAVLESIRALLEKIKQELGI